MYSKHLNTITRAATALTVVWATTAGVSSARAQDRNGWPAEIKVAAVGQAGTYQPIADYLGKKLNLKVTFVPLADVSGTIDGILKRQVDLVWYPSYTSVEAMFLSDGNIERLAMREEDRKVTSVFIAQASTGAKSLSDLSGKTFTFGPKESQEAHLMARYWLSKNGIDANKAFSGQPAYAASEDAVIQAIASGSVQAGVVSQTAWDKSSADKSKVVVVYTTLPYPTDNWAARKDLPGPLKTAMKDAFLTMDDASLLKLQNTKKYVEAHDRLWVPAEQAARSAGMLVKK